MRYQYKAVASRRDIDEKSLRIHASRSDMMRRLCEVDRKSMRIEANIFEQSMGIDAIRCEPMRYLCEVSGNLGEAMRNQCESVRYGCGEPMRINASWHESMRSWCESSAETIRNRYEMDPNDASRCKSVQSMRIGCKSMNQRGCKQDNVYFFHIPCSTIHFAVQDYFKGQNITACLFKGSQVRGLSDYLGSPPAIVTGGLRASR